MFVTGLNEFVYFRFENRMRLIFQVFVYLGVHRVRVGVGESAER